MTTVLIYNGLSASDCFSILVSAPVQNKEKVVDYDGQAVMMDLFTPFPKDDPSTTPTGEDSQHFE